MAAAGSTNASEAAADADDCAVCLEPIQIPCKLHCGHTMHSHCLLRVLCVSARSSGASCAPCPCCRSPFDAEEVAPHAIDRESTEALAEYKLALQNFTPPSRFQNALWRHPDGSIHRGRSLSCCLMALFTLSPLIGLATIPLTQLTGAPSPFAAPMATAPTAPVTFSQCDAWLARAKQQQLPPVEARLEAVGGLVGWLLGGFVGEYIGQELSSAFRARSDHQSEDSPPPPPALAHVTASACAIKWMDAASASLDAGRPRHSVAHARNALAAASPDVTPLRQPLPMRPLILMSLMRALEAAAGEERRGLSKRARRSHAVYAQRRLASFLTLPSPLAVLASRPSPLASLACICQGRPSPSQRRCWPRLRRPATRALRWSSQVGWRKRAPRRRCAGMSVELRARLTVASLGDSWACSS